MRSSSLPRIPSVWGFLISLLVLAINSLLGAPPTEAFVPQQLLSSLNTAQRGRRKPLPVLFLFESGPNQNFSGDRDSSNGNGENGNQNNPKTTNNGFFFSNPFRSTPSESSGSASFTPGAPTPVPSFKAEELPPSGVPFTVDASFPGANGKNEEEESSFSGNDRSDFKEVSSSFSPPSNNNNNRQYSPYQNLGLIRSSNSNDKNNNPFARSSGLNSNSNDNSNDNDESNQDSDSSYLKKLANLDYYSSTPRDDSSSGSGSNKNNIQDLANRVGIDPNTLQEYDDPQARVLKVQQLAKEAGIPEEEWQANQAQLSQEVALLEAIVKEENRLKATIAGIQQKLQSSGQSQDLQEQLQQAKEEAILLLIVKEERLAELARTAAQQHFEEKARLEQQGAIRQQQQPFQKQQQQKQQKQEEDIAREDRLANVAREATERHLAEKERLAALAQQGSTSKEKLQASQAKLEQVAREVAEAYLNEKQRLEQTTERREAQQAEEKTLQQAEVTRRAEEWRLAQEEQQRLAKQQAERVAEAQRIAADEAKKRQKEEEQQRVAAQEQKRREEEAQKVEQQRVAAENQKRKEEQAKLAAEEQRKKEEQARLAAEEQKRKEEQARLAAEEQKKKQEAIARLAEEQRKKEEEALLAEEQRRKEEEQARLAVEQRRKEEEQARLAEEQRRKEEQARLAEEQRLKKETARQAEQKRREDQARSAEEEKRRKQEEAERLAQDVFRRLKEEQQRVAQNQVTSQSPPEYQQQDSLSQQLDQQQQSVSRRQELSPSEQQRLSLMQLANGIGVELEKLDSQALLTKTRQIAGQAGLQYDEWEAEEDVLVQKAALIDAIVREEKRLKARVAELSQQIQGNPSLQKELEQVKEEAILLLIVKEEQLAEIARQAAEQHLKEKTKLEQAGQPSSPSAQKEEELLQISRKYAEQHLAELKRLEIQRMEQVRSRLSQKQRYELYQIAKGIGVQLENLDWQALLDKTRQVAGAAGLQYDEWQAEEAQLVKEAAMLEAIVKEENRLKARIADLSQRKQQDPALEQQLDSAKEEAILLLIIKEERLAEIARQAAEEHLKEKARLEEGGAPKSERQSVVEEDRLSQVARKYAEQHITEKKRLAEAAQVAESRKLAEEQKVRKQQGSSSMSYMKPLDTNSNSSSRSGGLQNQSKPSSFFMEAEESIVGAGANTRSVESADRQSTPVEAPISVPNSSLGTDTNATTFFADLSKDEKEKLRPLVGKQEPARTTKANLNPFQPKPPNTEPPRERTGFGGMLGGMSQIWGSSNDKDSKRERADNSSANVEPTGEVRRFNDGAQRGSIIVEDNKQFINPDRYFFSNQARMRALMQEKKKAASDEEVQQLVEKMKNYASVAALGFGLPLTLYFVSTLFALDNIQPSEVMDYRSKSPDIDNTKSYSASEKKDAVAEGALDEAELTSDEMEVPRSDESATVNTDSSGGDDNAPQYPAQKDLSQRNSDTLLKSAEDMGTEHVMPELPEGSKDQELVPEVQDSEPKNVGKERSAQSNLGPDADDAVAMSNNGKAETTPPNIPGSSKPSISESVNTDNRDEEKTTIDKGLMPEIAHEDDQRRFSKPDSTNDATNAYKTGQPIMQESSESTKPDPIQATSPSPPFDRHDSVAETNAPASESEKKGQSGPDPSSEDPGDFLSQTENTGKLDSKPTQLRTNDFPESKETNIGQTSPSKKPNGVPELYAPPQQAEALLSNDAGDVPASEPRLGVEQGTVGKKLDEESQTNDLAEAGKKGMAEAIPGKQKGSGTLPVERASMGVPELYGPPSTSSANPATENSVGSTETEENSFATEASAFFKEASSFAKEVSSFATEVSSFASGAKNSRNEGRAAKLNDVSAPSFASTSQPQQAAPTANTPGRDAKSTASSPTLTDMINDLSSDTTSAVPSSEEAASSLEPANGAPPYKVEVQSPGVTNGEPSALADNAKTDSGIQELTAATGKSQSLTENMIPLSAERSNSVAQATTVDSDQRSMASGEDLTQSTVRESDIAPTVRSQSQANDVSAPDKPEDSQQLASGTASREEYSTSLDESQKQDGAKLTASTDSEPYTKARVDESDVAPSPTTQPAIVAPSNAAPGKESLTELLYSVDGILSSPDMLLHTAADSTASLDQVVPSQIFNTDEEVATAAPTPTIPTFSQKLSQRMDSFKSRTSQEFDTTLSEQFRRARADSANFGENKFDAELGALKNSLSSTPFMQQTQSVNNQVRDNIQNARDSFLQGSRDLKRGVRQGVQSVRDPITQRYQAISQNIRENIGSKTAPFLTRAQAVNQETREKVQSLPRAQNPELREKLASSNTPFFKEPRPISTNSFVRWTQEFDKPWTAVRSDPAPSLPTTSAKASSASSTMSPEQRQQQQPQQQVPQTADLSAVASDTPSTADAQVVEAEHTPVAWSFSGGFHKNNPNQWDISDNSLF